MQERQVSSAAQRHPLPDPFFVLATQNPIEQEGTYPLPEAQFDRFLFKVFVGYPTPEEERLIYRRTTGSAVEQVERGAGGEEIPAAARAGAPGADLGSLLDYAMALVRATRTGEPTDRPTRPNGSPGAPGRGPARR